MSKTLVVLAAGMGSRFGGSKQTFSVGENGEFIIDYSIYDAIRNGFDKVVFIIRKKDLDTFKETVGKRISNNIKVEYAFQELDNLPIDINIEREKPLGTGHALYCARDYIDGPFAVITSDDFYGPQSFNDLSKFLDNYKGIGIIGYKANETIIGDEVVKRGIIKYDGDKLKSVIECEVRKEDDHILCKPLNGNEEFNTSLDTPVSMLMCGFNMDFIPVLEKRLINFLNTANLEKDEFYLPDVIDFLVDTNQVYLVKTNSKWMGMTYKEDAIKVQEEIKKYVNDGTYKNNLWS